jgi:hypothetical protein
LEERRVLRQAAQDYVTLRDPEDIEGAVEVVEYAEYASAEWKAFERLRAALSGAAQEQGETG